MIDLDYLVVCQGMFGVTGGHFRSSLLALLLGV